MAGMVALKVRTGGSKSPVIITQIVKQVLGDVHFQGLNNKLRYPVYSTRYQSYAFLVIEKNETDELHKMLSNLKIYLQDLSVRI